MADPMKFFEGIPFDVPAGAAEVTALAKESSRVQIDEFRQLVMNCVASGASDLTIQSNKQPRAEIHGRQFRLTRRIWTVTDVELILSEVYGSSNAMAEINGRSILDFAWDIRVNRTYRQRFRINATGIHTEMGKGVEITLRALPAQTPTLQSVGLDPDLMRWLKPRNGIVIIAGATGQGKSTTMAAITRAHLESQTNPVKIVDIQKPIEFPFDDVTRALEGSPSIIGQSEVGQHIRSFSDGVWSALRRAPDIINVGEGRDAETILASIEASLTGHLVYTTTHAGTVSETLRRMVTAFGPEDRESRAFDLITSLRFVMTQYLLPTADGKGRTPAREMLALDAGLRARLAAMTPDEWPSYIDAVMRGDDAGSVSAGAPRIPMERSIRRLLKDGVISEAVARPYLMAGGGDE